MSQQLNDNFHIWRIKLELAQQGNSQALEDIKGHCFTGTSDLGFIQNNFHDALRNSQIKFLKQSQNCGTYELYSQVPIFLVLEGQIQLRCLNLQGDQQTMFKIQQKGVLIVNKDKVATKFGEANVNIVTNFHLQSSKGSIVIEINQESRRKIENQTTQVASLVGLRQQNIMKKYMLFPLKYIRIQQYDSKTPKIEEKFYLLEGRACYYQQKAKERYILSVYQEGYINPKQFQNTDTKLYIFQNSKVLIFEEQFMRDDAVAGVQAKRTEHIQALVKAYQKVSAEEIKKIQLKLINNYKLNKKQVDKNIYGIVEPVPVIKEKQESSKRISTKNDLISTSSSIKEKCRIRISKKKKII